MVFNAVRTAQSLSTERFSVGLQVLTGDVAKPVAPTVFTLYIPELGENITKVVFASKPPENEDGVIFVEVNESKGTNYVELPVTCGEFSGVYPVYINAMWVYTGDDGWLGLSGAGLYIPSSKKWVTL